VLKFHKNLYDTLKNVVSAMGTDPHPQWLLVFNTGEQTYSAVNYKDTNEIIEFSLMNNLIGVCLIDPKDVIQTLNHREPHLICEAMHEWCTLHRPHPTDVALSMFFPDHEPKENNETTQHQPAPDDVDNVTEPEPQSVDHNQHLESSDDPPSAEPPVESEPYEGGSLPAAEDITCWDDLEDVNPAEITTVRPEGKMIQVVTCQHCGASVSSRKFLYRDHVLFFCHECDKVISCTVA